MRSTVIPPEVRGEIRSDPAYALWLQRSLNSVQAAGLRTDGVLGRNTHAAVQTFQRRAGLAENGVVGPQTEAMLVRAGAAPPPGLTPSASSWPGPFRTPTRSWPGPFRTPGGAPSPRVPSGPFMPTWAPSAPRTTVAPYRPCCILAPTLTPLNPSSNIADPAALGVHGSAGEAMGLIYTGGAGFVDLGHLRDVCDMTKRVYDRLRIGSVSPAYVNTDHGQAVWDARRLIAAPSMWTSVARAIAYDDSFGYEILTYWIMRAAAHNSAFSPEDLPSNYLGTLVAERAIARGGSFGAAVTAELNALMAALDAQPKAETLRAFNMINGRWVDFANVASILMPGYLRRRNFGRVPRKAGHPSDRPTPPWVTAGLGSAETFYNYAHVLGRVIPKSSFLAEVARIRTDARRRYGPNYAFP